MGIADELEKLEELHRKGTLSDEEFERAKTSVLGTTAHNSRSTAADQEINSSLSKPTQAKEKSSATSKLLRNLIVLAILVGVVWFFLARTVGKQGAERLVSTAVHTPITLSDEIENMPANSWKALPLNLSYTGNLDLAIEVVRGNPVDVYVIDRTELENVKNDKTFNHYGDFMASKTKSYKRSGRMRGGVYYLLLRDKTLGILSSSSSDIKIVARLEP